MSTMLRALQRLSVICTLALLPAVSFGGFFISNGQLVDDNGTPFVMRGVAYPYTWYSWRGTAAVQQDLANIAATRANTVRYVLSTGGQWARIPGAEVSQVIQWAKDNRMISVLEVHDSTGWSEGSGSVNISNAVQYWTSADIRAAINGQEDFVIINIANEPFGNNTTAQYVQQTADAIRALRTAGITHTIMIDAANWGQDWSNTMRDNAMTLWQADSQRNLLFSVHMYEVYGQASTISSYMQAFDDMGLPLVIGEFGLEHNGQNVDEATIMAQAQQRGNGYIGWSWSGNGGCCTFLDVVSNFSTTLTTWGQILVNGPNGIFATSVPASVFGQVGNNLTVSPTSLTFGSGASSAPVTVTSNVSWTVSETLSWITVSPTGGSGNGSFTVSATANTGAARSGTITVNGGGLSRPITVSQPAVTNTLTIAPTSLSFAATASSSTVTVTSNGGWTVTDDQSWISVSPASGSNNGSFAVSATANTGTASRSGVVTVSGGGLTPRTIAVTQAGTSANNLTVSPTSLPLASGASSGTVSVTANVTWTVGDDQTWLSTSSAGGSGNGSFTVSATANTGTSSRSGVVSVTGGGLPARTITVTQAGQGGTGGTCANPITFTGNTGNFNTAGAACFRTNQTINGWGCYNFDGRTLTVSGVARTCGQMPLTRAADGYYYFSATAGQYPWAGIYAW